MAGNTPTPASGELGVFDALDDVELSLRYLSQQLSVLEELTALSQLSDQNRLVELPRDALAAVFRNLCWSAEAINEKILGVHRQYHETIAAAARAGGGR